MLSRLSIRHQVLIVVVAFCALISVICVAGLLDMQRANAELHAAYESRDDPMQQQSLEKAERDSQRAGLVFAALCATGFLMAAVAGPLLIRGIVRPLHGVEEFALRMADGDLSSEALPVDGSGVAGRLLDSLARMQASLRRTVSDVRVAADGLAADATQAAHRNSTLADCTETQARSLNVAASASHELTASIQHNEAAARRADLLAHEAGEAARRGGEDAQRIVLSMSAFERTTSRMAEITDVIDGIAFQTNILALNAAVEAARAGDGGGAFSAVASEVRSLATRSADAAKEIASLITGSVSEVRAGVSLARQTGASIAEVVGRVKRLGECVTGIGIASDEQAIVIRAVNDAVCVLERMAGKNAALVEEGAAAAGILRAQALRLNQSVAMFEFEDVTLPAVEAMPLLAPSHEVRMAG